MATVSRRRALTALAKLGGAIGVAGVAVPLVATAAQADTASQELSLEARNPRVTGDRRIPGSPFLVRADVLRGGMVVGEFFAQAMVANRHDLLAPGIASLQTHTFVLDGGTLHGTGALAQDGTGSFAVTGGTGDYHCAAGSYTVTEAQDGASQYSFILKCGKAPSDGR